jgi:predicted NBD/HSP70 family sugar kinase
MNDEIAAPHNTLRIKPRGSSQGGLRQYNERVVLQSIRSHGPLASAELARLTGLTAQTISTITKRLLEEGLLLRQAAVRGKVGQPSVPLQLNPNGAYSVGVNVGRRHLDVLLINFAGQVIDRSASDYTYPTPEMVAHEVNRLLTPILNKLDDDMRHRIQGIGIAAPLAMGGWQQLLGFPSELAEQWKSTDLRAEIEKLTQLPVDQLKDTAAACVAELVAGNGRNIKSFLYVFVDTFIGGGLVIDSHLRAGAQGNAGAIGSLPLGLASPDVSQTPAQLLRLASLVTLEKRFIAAGLAPGAVSDERALTGAWRDITLPWVQMAASAIALAVNSTACLLEIDGVILDGAFSRELLSLLEKELRTAMNRYDWEGVMRPELIKGSIGSDARALGGAYLPLYANFAPDRDLFLKVD